MTGIPINPKMPLPGADAPRNSTKTTNTPNTLNGAGDIASSSTITNPAITAETVISAATSTAGKAVAGGVTATTLAEKVREARDSNRTATLSAMQATEEPVKQLKRTRDVLGMGKDLNFLNANASTVQSVLDEAGVPRDQFGVTNESNFMDNILGVQRIKVVKKAKTESSTSTSGGIGGNSVKQSSEKQEQQQNRSQSVDSSPPPTTNYTVKRSGDRIELVPEVQKQEFYESVSSSPRSIVTVGSDYPYSSIILMSIYVVGYGLIFTGILNLINGIGKKN
jgi:hypothetical protein